MNRDFFTAKILCALHQAEFRKFKIINSYKIREDSRGIFTLNNIRVAEAYILNFIIEGKIRYRNGSSINENVARRLGVSLSVIDSFNEGFVHGGIVGNYSPDSDEQFCCNFGKGCNIIAKERKLL